MSMWMALLGVAILAPGLGVVVYGMVVDTGLRIGILVTISLVCGMLLIALAFNQPAHADDNFVSPIPECQLADGNLDGEPCVHTAPNGKQYIDWSSAHRQHQNSLLPPVDGTYWQLCTQMGDCP